MLEMPKFMTSEYAYILVGVGVFACHEFRHL